MKKPLLIAFASCLYILGITSCSNNDEKFLSEGSIEYEATLIDQSNPMVGLAPNKMTIKFKDNKSCAEMSAGMGLFSTSFISDPEKRTLTQLVKVLNKKFSLVQNETEVKKENESYPVTITPLKEKKIIAGYNCEKALVKVNDENGTEFYIYYTKDLNIQNANFANPFSSIDAVLMEYQMKKFGLEMRFTAKSVKNESVDDSCFELPTDYKPVSMHEMNEIFIGLQ